MDVEPGDRVGDRVGGHLDVGIEHDLVVGAGAVQHQVVRDPVADVGVAVQVGDLDPGVGEARPAVLDHVVGDLRVLAVVDQRDRDAPDAARLARVRDRVASVRRHRSNSAMSGRNVTTLTVNEEGSKGCAGSRGSEWGSVASARPEGSGRIVGESRGNVNRAAVARVDLRMHRTAYT